MVMTWLCDFIFKRKDAINLGGGGIMGCLWGVTQLFGYKNVLLKNIGISTLVEFGWSLGGVVYAKESV